ncbi:MAG: zinc ABC transporter substrate-binding protein [Deltaproteobacteria bacterium]|nr:zinc ABC transporter substrate-binding protein [Deltaproteobacteria bacterium]
MRTIIADCIALLLLASCPVSLAANNSNRNNKKLKVVTSLSAYAAIAEEIGGDLVKVDWIVNGDQDPHFVRPRPSLARKLADADLFVSTGLDLELWAPSLIDISGNDQIRSGQRRYVSASQGVRLLEVPKVKSRSEGGVHIYGNPHFITNPLAAEVTARNIATGLSRIDPAHEKQYAENLKRFDNEIDQRLFGAQLLHILGPDILHRLARHSNNMIDFLKTKKYKDRPLIDLLGGWLKEGLDFREKKIVTYHKQWVYFADLFGLDIVNHVEPRPAIPPTPKHIDRLIKQMREGKVHVILAASYYDLAKVRLIASQVGAKPIIVATGTGGDTGLKTYCELIDNIVDKLSAAFK